MAGEMERTHILTDDTLRYIADEESAHIQDAVTKNYAYNISLAAMNRVREQYEKVFFWNEARLFRRIFELEQKLNRGDEGQQS